MRFILNEICLSSKKNLKENKLRVKHSMSRLANLIFCFRQKFKHNVKVKSRGKQWLRGRIKGMA